MRLDRKDYKGCRTIADVLQKLGINRETVVVAKNGTLAPESEKVTGKDRLEVIQVIYGG